MDEDRTQTENQEVDETDAIPLEEAIRRCVLVGSSEGETVYTLWTDGIEDAVTGEDRGTEQLEVTVLRDEVAD